MDLMRSESNRTETNCRTNRKNDPHNGIDGYFYQGKARRYYSVIRECSIEHRQLPHNLDKILRRFGF